jgi:hypothetical protein
MTALGEAGEADKDELDRPRLLHSVRHEAPVAVGVLVRVRVRVHVPVAVSTLKHLFISCEAAPRGRVHGELILQLVSAED